MLPSRVLAFVVFLSCVLPRQSCALTHGEPCITTEECHGTKPPSPVEKPVDVKEVITKISGYIYSTLLEYLSALVELLTGLFADPLGEFVGKNLIPNDPVSTVEAVFRTIESIRKGPSVPQLINFVLNAMSKMVGQFVIALKKFEKMDPLKGEAHIFEWFSQPTRLILQTIAEPASRRIRAMQAFYDETDNVWKVPTQQVFNAIVSMQADILKELLEKKGEEEGSFNKKNVVVAGLYYMKDTYMKFAGHYGSPPVTMFASHHHTILKKLKEKDMGSANELVNLLTFVIWSGTGFNMVYKELVKECWSNRHEIKVQVIEGEEYDPEHLVPLKNFLDRANHNRSVACEHYRSVFGDREGRDAYNFIAKQFYSLLRSTYDMYTPVRKDVKAVDIVAQTLLGDLSETCFLWSLCRFGYNINHLNLNSTGVNLFVGLLVNGHTTFSGFMKTELISKVGTPRMAKAIQDGLDNQCNKYAPAESECFNMAIFLEDYNEVKKDMLAKKLVIEELKGLEDSYDEAQTEEVIAEDDYEDTSKNPRTEGATGTTEGSTGYMDHNKGRYERTTEAQEAEMYTEATMERIQEHSPVKNG